MRGTTVMIGLLLVTGGLAGCIGGDEGNVDGTTGEEIEPTDQEGQAPEGAPDGQGADGGEAGGQVDATWLNGSVAGVGSASAGYLCLQACDSHVLPFDVGPNATAIILEAAWEGGDEMALQADAPDEATCEQVDPVGLLVACQDPEDATGPSPLRLEITDPTFLAATGEWTAGLWAEATPEPVALTLVASVIYDDTPPAEVVHLGPT